MKIFFPSEEEIARENQKEHSYFIDRFKTPENSLLQAFQKNTWEVNQRIMDVVCLVFHIFNFPLNT